MKSQLIGKDLDAGQDWKEEEKGMAEDEMVGWHHWLNGRDFEQTPGDSEGQESLACCSPWDHKESEQQQWDQKYLHNDVKMWFVPFTVQRIVLMLPNNNSKIVFILEEIKSMTHL